MATASSAPDSLRQVLLRHGMPGFIGSAILTLGALGVGWLPLSSGMLNWSYIELLRGTTAGTILSRVLIFIGVALLLQAWLVLGYDLLAGLRLNTSRMWAVLIAWTLPLLVTPPLFSRDVYSYFAQGRLIDSGFDPYSTGVSVIPGWFQDGVDPMWAETPTPYGPLFLMVERGVANFAQSQPTLSALVFQLVALLGVALMAVYVPRLAFMHGIDPARALWIGVLNPLVLMHFVAAAHNDALMVGLVVAGLALAAEGRGMLGAAAVGLAGTVKPIALLAMPFIGLLWAGVRATWPKRVGYWVATVGVTAVVFAILSLIAGVGLGWINALTTPGEVRTWLSPMTALGMLVGGLLQITGQVETNDGTVLIFRVVGILVALAITAWLCIRPQGRSVVRGAAIALLAIVALGPVVQPWYLLWSLPLFAATGLSRNELRVVIVLTAGFAIHGIAESSSTSDSLLEFSDGISIIAAFVLIGLVLLASPRERQLVFGGPVSHGMLPADDPSRARAKQMVFVGAS